MQKRNVLNSSRLLELKKNRRKATVNKSLFFFLGILLILILLVFLSRIKALNIGNIEVSGNQVIDTEGIKNVVQQQITGNYFWVFPKSNLFFYPENTIKNNLQNKFKRLEDINLAVKNNKTLEISVTEHKAAYMWCGTIPPNTTSVVDCYFLDDSGYIFDKAPYFSGDVYFKFYGLPMQAGVPNSTSLFKADSNPSGLYFSQQNFKKLVSFRDMLVSFGLKPVSLYVTDDGDVQVFLSSTNSGVAGPQIIFKIDEDYQNVAENLEAAITTEPLQSEFKNKYSSLQYIDLRFGNKVYYKFTTTQAATTATN